MKKWSEKLSSADLYQVMLHLIVLALAVTVFVLAKQNRELKSIGDQVKQVDIKSGDPFSLGELVPVNTPNAVDTSINQLLFLFTTKCPFCKRNVSSWEELKVAALGKQVVVAGICLDAPDEASRYTKEQQITYRVYVPKDFSRFREVNHIYSVPTTILRSRSGYAEHVWIGMLQPDKMKEIAEAISLSQHPQTTQRRRQ